MLRIHFKDEGQDCLRWDIDAEGAVQDCDLQKWMWVGVKVDMTQTIAVGKKLKVTFKDGDQGTWKYRITKVERLPPAVPA